LTILSYTDSSTKERKATSIAQQLDLNKPKKSPTRSPLRWERNKKHMRKWGKAGGINSNLFTRQG